MGITKNSIDFGSGFNIKSQGPIDSRMVVDYINDLTTVWDKDVPAYIGMVVYVKETGDIYVLTGGKNVININNYAKDINNWKKQITDLPNMEDYVTDDELITELSSYATNETVSNISDKVDGVESSLNTTIDSLNTTIENLSDLSNDVDKQINQINGLIGNINSFNILVVDELPETGDSHTIYFVGVDGGVQNDVKNEYIYIDGKWELIGNTRIDLSDYVTETELEGKGYLTEHQDLTGYVTTDALSDYVTDGELNTALSSKQDIISNLDEIISGAALGATALQSVPDEYATKTFVTNEIANAKLEGGDIDLSGFVERDELKGYVKTDALSDYVTETELEAKGYLTEHQDLTGYVTDGKLNTALSSKQDTLTAGNNISIDNSNVISAFIDLSNYYTIPQIDGLIKGIEDLIGDVNSLMGEILGS